MDAVRDGVLLGRCAVRWPWLIAVADLVIAIVLAAVLGFPANVVAALAFASTSLVLLPFTSVELSRKGENLVVEYGPLRWPRQRFLLADIEEVEIADIRPREWGGWGYRGSQRFMKRTAIVLRRGPGLKLTLREGRKLAISLDEPERAAALLRAELER
ncbi:MAG: hypothetical protein ACR2OD_05510 [Gaiellaceae bacterium]